MIDLAALDEAVHRAVGDAASTLRPDVLAALRAAVEREDSPRGRSVLAQLIDNAEIAAGDRVPLCQDTGSCRVRVELCGADGVPCDLSARIDAAVARAYRDHGLRASMVRDALVDRGNTGDNTPAIVEIVLREVPGATIEVMLKGGGSDNASALVMLPPSAGVEGVRRVVRETVEAKATGACPPLLVGVGVGGTFDTVAALAKKGLMRQIGTVHPVEEVATLERTLLADANATGIGPAGLGGRTTALAVHVTTAPCHIAALPVAVNMGCSAVRTARVELP